MLKKIILLLAFSSFNLMANCPNISGSYTCLNYEGVSYNQDISIEKINNGIKYIFKNKDSKISWNIDGKQHTNNIESFGEKIKILYRGKCSNHTYINEFMLDNKVTVARGNSEFYLTKEGYNQKNTIIFNNGTKKTSSEECKKIN